MKLLSTASSAIYYAFIAALIASVSVYAWHNAAALLPSLAQRTAATLPATATIGAGIGSLALMVLLEALYPLRSLSLGRWVYADRPRGRMRGVDKLSITQLAGVSLLGLALCTSLDLPFYAAIAFPLLRLALGWRSFELASLLRAGRTVPSVFLPLEFWILRCLPMPSPPSPLACVRAHIPRLRSVSSLLGAYIAGGTSPSVRSPSWG